MGPRVPMVSIIVWPWPSGERCSFSMVMPSEISALYWSSSMAFPSILMVNWSAEGASNRPGMSSVMRMRLMVDEPLLTRVIVD